MPFFFHIPILLNQVSKSELLQSEEEWIPNSSNIISYWEQKPDVTISIIILCFKSIVFLLNFKPRTSSSKLIPKGELIHKGELVE